MAAHDAQRHSLRIAILLALCGLSGCTGLQQSYAQRLLDQLLVRAAFDLNCSRLQLDAVPLDRADLRESRVGVHGCGRQATYVRLYNLMFRTRPRSRNSRKNSSVAPTQASK